MAAGQTQGYSQWLRDHQDLTDDALSKYEASTPSQASDGQMEVTTESGPVILFKDRVPENMAKQDDVKKVDQKLSSQQTANAISAVGSAFTPRKEMASFANPSAYAPRGGRIQSDAPTQPIGAPAKPALGTVMKVIGAIFSFGASVGISKANESAAKNEAIQAQNAKGGLK